MNQDAYLPLLLDAIEHSDQVEDVIPSLTYKERHKASAFAVWSASKDGRVVHPIILHAILYAGREKGHNDVPLTPGEYRLVDVFVGGRRCPPAGLVSGLMAEWWTDDVSDHPWESHVRFEQIHPFVDGNGRVGRLVLWNMEMIQGTELTIVTLDNRAGYYARLVERMKYA